MFVDSLIAFLNNGKIPSQDEFVEKYLKSNSNQLREIISDQRKKLALEARLRRTYPSLIRDIHLQALLQEKGFTSTYDRNMDVQSGVDCILMYKGRQFNIHSFVATKRGSLGRAIKNQRHNFSGIHLDLALNLDDPETKKVGDFFLYLIKKLNFWLKQWKKS